METLPNPRGSSRPGCVRGARVAIRTIIVGAASVCAPVCAALCGAGLGASMLAAQSARGKAPAASVAAAKVAATAVAALLKPLATWQLGGERHGPDAVAAGIAAVRDASSRQAWMDGLRAVVVDGAMRLHVRRFAAAQLRKIVTAEDLSDLLPLLRDPVSGPMVAPALSGLVGWDVDRSLRMAVPGCDPATRIMLMRGLGERRLVAAVPVLAAQLRQRDFDLVRIAAAALGEIGDITAERALRTAFRTALARRREEIGAALLRCGDHRLAQGNWKAASALYRLLLDGDEALSLRLMALRGVARVGGAPGFRTLVARLGDGEARVASLAAQELPRLPGLVLQPSQTRRLIERRTSVAVRVILLAGFARRGQADAIPFVERVLDQIDARRAAGLGSGDRAVLGAGLQALAHLQGAAAADRLARSLVGSAVTVSRVIHRVLVGLEGSSVDLALGSILSAGELPVRTRTALVRVLVARPGSAADSVLAVVAKEAKAYPIRLVALRGLVARARPVAQKDVFAAWVRSAAGQERAVLDAWAAQCVRREEAAGLTAFASLGDEIPAALRGAWLHVLRLVGGAGAARLVGADATPGLGSRVLAELAAWPDAGALPVLASRVRSASTPGSRRAAIAAYLQLLARRNGSDAAAWRFALRQLENDEDAAGLVLRRRSLAGLGASGGAEDLGPLRALLAQPPTRDAAARALVTILTRTPRVAGAEMAARKLLTHARDPEVRDWAAAFVKSVTK